MKTANKVLAGATVLAISTSALLAQQQQQGGAGVITGINRLTLTVSIEPLQSGTVGSTAAVAGPAEEFKAKDAAMLEAVHAGDRVTYSLSGNGGTKTLAKLEREK
jgi:hypothetical protein